MSAAEAIYRQTSYDGGNVRVNASGNPVKSVRHSLSGISSILKALPKRVDYDEFNMPDLSALAGLHHDVDQALGEVVDRLRRQTDDYGRPVWSWADIGGALGTTRQAAQITYGRRRRRPTGEG